ncbi:oligosaccharide flippase family protein [Novosphingobium sediminicola]|uniref:O-antigen/teichoic acid export membrane protein n=1 Tax=Novosphingobium sediminicola TaxID=563162 RepID=A0A7W6CN60_9SPHN|nr:O-antigen/teichoic acid export membrane protein [Novosphingobium sediminicola]
MTGVGGSFSGKLWWTISGFLASSILRFSLNIILSRLLAPEVMGVMLVVNSVRLGIELLTDVGIEQNIIHHPDGAERHFRDTAWTMQVLRGLFLSLLFLAAAPFLAAIYHINIGIFLLAACSPVIGGLHSTAIFVLVKQMEVRRRNQFEMGSELLAFFVSVWLAWILRSVWAPAVALVCGVAIRSSFSYLLPDPRQTFCLDSEIRARIIHFGKWIMVTSLVMYAATNLDRLYLGRTIPLALVGIYGIARAMAELPTNLARRLGYQIIFPALASASQGAEEREKSMALTRFYFVLTVSLGLGFGAGVADWVIALLYDPRYVSAGWILSVLLVGAIFAVLSNINEALMLGAGRPVLSSLANAARFCTLALWMPIGLGRWGFPGAVLAIAFTEICQYGYIGLGLWRMGKGYWRQDVVAGGLALATLGGTCAVRYALGIGMTFPQIGGVVP